MFRGGRFAAAPGTRIFPEASPKKAVGTLQRNTIGTLNQCSDTAFRDQLRIARRYVLELLLDAVVLCTVPTVFCFGRLGEKRVFRGRPRSGRPGTLGIPRGIPKNTVGTRPKNTIGTRDNVSKHAFRDQLRFAPVLANHRNTRCNRAFVKVAPRRVWLSPSFTMWP